MLTRQPLSWLALPVVLMAFRGAQQLQAPTDQQGHAHHNAIGQQDDAPKSFWQRTADDPIALYTLCLAAFTAVLTVVSIVQICFLSRSDKTARTAADAASLQAQAAVRVQGPFVEVRSFRCFPQQQIDFVQDKTLSFGPYHDWGCDLINFGQTTAFITEIRYSVNYGDRPTSNPRDDTRYPVPEPIVIHATGQYRFDPPESLLDIDLAEAVKPDGKRDQVWAWVRVTYYDQLGVTTETGSIARRIDKGIHPKDGYSVGEFIVQNRPPYTFRRYTYPKAGDGGPVAPNQPDATEKDQPKQHPNNRKT